MVQIAGSIKFGSGNITHEFINNTYAFIATDRGGCVTLSMNNQDAYFTGNRYSYIFSNYGGGVLRT